MRLVGTELKLNVHMKPMGDVHLSECEWEVFVGAAYGRGYTLKKEECIIVDEDNYLVLVDTTRTGAGRVKLKLTVDVPDTDYKDGFRREVVMVETDIKIERV